MSTKTPARNSTDYLHVESAVARKALAVAFTKSGGSVLGALRAHLQTPAGGWPQTRETRIALIDAILCAVTEADTVDAVATADELVAAALKAGWPRHPGRDEAGS